jgi:hypothetical protein
MQDPAAYCIDREERIRYALSKQVPAMRMNVEIHTDYGTLHFHYKDARRIANLAQTLLEQQLKRIAVANAKASCRRR